MSFRNHYNETYQKLYSQEMIDAENAGMDLADCDGWISLERLLDIKLTVDEAGKAISALWEKEIDAVGIDEEGLSDEEVEEVRQIIQIIVENNKKEKIII